MQPLIVAEQVREGLEDFLKATFPATTPGFDSLMADFLGKPSSFAQGPYVTVNLPFRKHLGKPAFSWLDAGFVPHAHQARAFERLTGEGARSTLVATGTGSGKTECFLFPVLEHCRQQREAGRRGIKAILIYPMNALATDQAGRLAKLIVTHPAVSRITAGLYVGETAGEPSGTVRHIEDDRYTVITDRERMHEEPPDILLTNYKMLDFLLIRARDAGLWKHNLPDTLRYLVVDELHTFDGAQGTDLACLIRRMKHRLGTSPGALACVGTSATLGSDGNDHLLDFASKVFGESFDAQAVIGEDRQSVAEYLSDQPVDHMRTPTPADYAALDVGRRTTPEYIAAQYPLWFEGEGRADQTMEVESVDFQVRLGQQLKQHVAFQNLLRHLHRLGGRAVPVADLADAMTGRLKDPDHPDYRRRWLLSLLSLVAFAADSKDSDGGRRPFLTVRVELWLRELRRMVASLDENPKLVHSDDLRGNEPGVHLPLIHCRDCHAMGWGSFVTPTERHRLKSDLNPFYAAFFGHDISTRFVFPGVGSSSPDRRKACTRCGTLTSANAPECNFCGSDKLIAVDVASNLRQRRRNGAPVTVSHHDCPYCDGARSLSIVGSAATSVASIGISQLFGSPCNDDRKLIAFSDSVQDAAHRAGFFEARNWRLNLRPAIAQLIHAAVARGAPLTLATLPETFRGHWMEVLGEAEYLKSFIPPDLVWMRAYEQLLETGVVAADDHYLRLIVHRGLAWAMLAEFGQDEHLGRTLTRTRTAAAALAPHALASAVTHAVSRWREKVDALGGVTEGQATAFLQGLIARMRQVGALWDEGLKGYARRGCNIFVYGQNAAEFALLNTPGRPYFLSLLPYHECEAVTGEDAVFYRGWAFKALPGLNRELDDSVLADVYRIALEALAEASVASNLVAEHAGTHVWGLEPAAFQLLDAASEWRCDSCRHAVVDQVGAALEATPCRRPACQGHYELRREEAPEFYRNLYLSAHVQRVRAREHTGLLERATREAIETEFKSGEVNVLSATSTLEMGIDIGDLSAVLMCSVPPDQASYVQRSGRAGRKNGNAFASTVALARPHDLYFWESPREMLAGNVTSPGVFLDASAVLERQLTAFSLDSWVRDRGEKAKIPRKLSDVLSAVRNETASKFPYPWLEHLQQNRGTLIDAFVGLFRQGTARLSPESERHLRTFIDGGPGDQGSLPWKVLQRFLPVIRDIEDLKRRRDRVEKEMLRIQNLPVRGQSDEDALEDLALEKTALTNLLKNIDQRDTLGFLTDQGLLPNYAFPEQGVLLDSVVIRERKKQEPDDQRIVTYEYERPGATAITELAPDNTFYAEGRRVTIEQVDVARDKPQAWRFCQSCSYCQPEATGEHHEVCPRCADPLWKDAGRLQTMLRLSKVYARSKDSESRIGDDTDNRDQKQHVRQILLDVAPQAVRQAWATQDESFPFAFEFLERVQFREVNFGEQGGDGQPIRIAGDEQLKPGFRICAECGTLQRPRRQEDAWKNHALYCSHRSGGPADVLECVFLYREFDSEGIRLLLPESHFAGSEESIHSFIAALQVGLQRRFRGAVDHLRIARDQRMAAGEEAPRQYLVIYDSVPGGTGYLKELMRDPQPLFQVLQGALDSLASCSCGSHESKDGCYRCVYTYHNSSARRHVSRRRAMTLLAKILEHKDTLKPVATVTQIKVSGSLMESEMERRFIEALRRKPPGDEPRLEVRDEMIHTRPGHAVECGGRRWLLVPQVTLDAEQGVVIPSRADFVFWPQNIEGVLPIAVFIDGWRFHKDRIGEDIAQRMAIARSGRFSVWTLTADDIAVALDPKARPPETLWADLLPASGDLGPAYKAFGVERLRPFHTYSAFAQLHARIAGTSIPTDETAIRLACVLALRIGAAPADEGAFRTLKDAPALRALLQQSTFDWLEKADLGRAWESPAGQLSAGVRMYRGRMQPLQAKPTDKGLQPLVVLRWTGQADEPLRRQSWQQWWQAANVLLPLTTTWLVADDGCDLAPLEESPALRPTQTITVDWALALDDAMPIVQAGLRAAMDAGRVSPIVGYELLDGTGRVAAQAELGWPEQKVAVLLDEEGRDCFESSGWKVLLAQPSLDVPELLRALN